MTRPLVSFVVPAYNAAQTIAETLQSLSGCDVADHEVIILDDGSSDGTAEIVARNLLPSWRIVQFGANRGLSTALNTGIAMARGLFIARLDADDVYVDGRITRQLAHLEANPHFAFCGTDLEYFGDRSGVYRHPLGQDACNGYLAAFCCFSHPSILIHRQRAGGELYYDERLDTSEDYDLWTRLQAAGRFGDNLEFIGVRYRVSGRSLTHTRTHKFLRNDLGIRIRVLTNLLKETEYFHKAALALMLSQIDFPTRRPDFVDQLRRHVEAAEPKPQFAAAWSIARTRLEKILARAEPFSGAPISLEDFKRQIIRFSAAAMSAG